MIESRSLQFLMPTFTFFFRLSFSNCKVVISTISSSKDETSVAPSTIIDNYISTRSTSKVFVFCGKSNKVTKLKLQRDMFTKLFTSVIIHVHVCVSKGQTILSFQSTQVTVGR